MCKARVFDKTRDDKNARLSLSSVPVSVLATVRFMVHSSVQSVLILLFSAMMHCFAHMLCESAHAVEHPGFDAHLAKSFLMLANPRANKVSRVCST